MTLPPDLPHLLLIYSNYPAVRQARTGLVPQQRLPGPSVQEAGEKRSCRERSATPSSPGAQEAPGAVHQVCPRHHHLPTMRQLGGAVITR